jgi:hypothetical protein
MSALAATLALALALPTAPATANDGSPDTSGQFPNVGAVVVTINENGHVGWRAAGSGTLISPDQFLTAHHIVDFIGWLQLSLDVTSVSVTFDGDLHAGPLPETVLYGMPVDMAGRESDLIPVDLGDTEFLPGYHPAANPGFNDLAILQLEPLAPIAITPVQLPTRTFTSTDFTADPVLQAAGYGTWFTWDTGQARISRGDPKTWAWNGTRNVSSIAYQGLTQTQLVTNANEQSRLGGGLCLGDSGAPLFHNGVEVALVIWGDLVCRSIGFSQRLDTPEVRDWLDTNMP